MHRNSAHRKRPTIFLLIFTIVVSQIIWRSPVAASSSPGELSWYNGIIFGNFIGYQADCEGPLAIQGTSQLGSTRNGISYAFDVGAASTSANNIIGEYYTNPHNYPALLLGGKVSDKSYKSNVKGGAIVMKNANKTSVEGNVFYQTVNYWADSTVDSFFLEARQTADRLTNQLPTANSSSITYSSSMLSGNLAQFENQNLDTDVNLLCVNITSPTGALQIGDVSLPAAIDQYDVVVFNIMASNVTFTGGSILYNGRIINTSAPRSSTAENAILKKVAQKVVWNMPNATNLRVAHYGVVGTVLAPNANITTNGGSINGQVFVGGLEQDGGFELHAFRLSNWWELKRTYGSLTIKKTDNSGLPLIGAVFEIRRQDGKPHVSSILVTGGEGSLSAGGKVLTVSVTDSISGSVTIKGLQTGDVLVEEIRAPDGYEKATNIQNPITIKNNTEEIITVVNQPLKYKLTVRKVEIDEQTGAEIDLPNIDFTLFGMDYMGNGYNQTKSTGSDGIVLFDNINRGIYSLIEESTPSSSDFSPITPITVLFPIVENMGGSETEMEIKLVNSRLPTGNPTNLSLKILKETTAGAPLRGVAFTLTAKDSLGNPVTAGFPKYATTDASGIAYFVNLDTTYTYNLQEDIPDGYELAPPFDREFTLTSHASIEVNNTWYGYHSVTVQNKPVLGKLSVRKKSDTGELLPNAVFNIYYSNQSGNRLGLYQGNLTTGSDGSFSINLPVGYYIISEQSAPPGYEMVTKEEWIHVGPGGQWEWELEIENRHKGRIMVTKIDYDNNDQTLAGATYEIWTFDRPSGQPQTYITTIVTGADGTAEYDGLPHGDYCLIEVIPPLTHEVDSEPIPFTISEEVVVISRYHANKALPPDPPATTNPGGGGGGGGRSPRPSTSPTPTPVNTPTPSPSATPEPMETPVISYNPFIPDETDPPDMALFWNDPEDPDWPETEEADHWILLDEENPFSSTEWADKNPQTKDNIHPFIPIGIVLSGWLTVRLWKKKVSITPQ